MKYSNFGFKLGLCVLGLGLSGVVSAACSITGTNASSVQADQGNGDYACTAVVSSKGVQLEDVSYKFPRGELWDIDGNGRVWFKVPRDAEGFPAIDVDLVSVRNNSGKRCNYNYADQPVDKNEGLTPSDLSAAKYVTFCADERLSLGAAPPPPEPISTVGDACDATFAYNQVVGGTFDVAIGYSKNFESNFEGLAVCANESLKQNKCINECIPQTPISELITDPTDPGYVSCAPNGDGRLPLACASCVYDRTDPNTGLNYCGFYENKVDLTDRTFKPSPKKKSLSAQIDVTTGSDCYTVTVGPMYGGRTYSYQQCP